MKKPPIKVSVSAEDIAAGVAGDCYRCPVAIALGRATDDSEANVYERDFELHIETNGRHIPAPSEVRQFVHAYDDQPRTKDNRLATYHEDFEMPRPFEFELPHLEDPEWQEQCYRCGELLDRCELDDEGICKDCLAKAVAR